MAQNVIISADYADETSVKLQLLKLKRSVDEAIRKLDTESLQVIKAEMLALETKFASFEASQKVQDNRLDVLEDTAPNTEITAADVINMYGGA